MRKDSSLSAYQKCPVMKRMWRVMSEECNLNALIYPDEIPEIEVVHLEAKTMQVQIDGWSDMGVIFKQGYVRYWVDYDYPNGTASLITRIEVLGTKKINNEECYEVGYVCVEPGGNIDINLPSYWYYAKRIDKIYWVRFTHKSGARTIVEEVDGSFIPTTITPGMHWHEHDTQRDATTGAVYVSRRRVETVEDVVKLRIGVCVHHCLRLVMLSTDAKGTSGHTLVEKYIDNNGLTILRRKYMGEDNSGSLGNREQLRQSPRIEHDNRKYYLWYDSVFL